MHQFIDLKPSLSSSSLSPDHCCSVFKRSLSHFTFCLYVGIVIWLPEEGVSTLPCMYYVAKAAIQNAVGSSGCGDILLQSWEVRWQLTCVQVPLNCWSADRESAILKLSVIISAASLLFGPRTKLVQEVKLSERHRQQLIISHAHFSVHLEIELYRIVTLVLQAQTKPCTGLCGCFPNLQFTDLDLTYVNLIH